MATLQISAENREKYKGFTAKQLRRKGLIPAVNYSNGVDNKHLVVQEKELMRTLSGKDVHVIELKLNNKDVELAVLQDIQRDCLTNRILHIDFLGVRQDMKTSVTVTIQLVGNPAGVKDGGVLEHSMRTVTVECLPKDVPERIVIDVTNYKLDDVIYLKDIPAPAGVNFLEKEMTQPVLSIHLPKQEKEAPVAPVEGVAGEGAAAAPGAAVPGAAAAGAAPAAGAKAAAPAVDKKAEKK